MSFANKTNGREYVNKSNSNPNKVQTMSYRNTLTNAQYSNSSNGDSYCYDEKNQHSSNSPKVVSESHGVQQHNTCPREPYSYKNNNPRIKQYPQNKNYSDRHYYNQRSSSPDDVIIPEIEHLREFIKEQTERFKIELSRHEGQMSNSPLPGGPQYNDQSNYKYNKPYGGISRQGNGLSASHSLGSIANTNSNVQPVQTLTVSPSCSDNSNRHPDARMSQGSLVVLKTSNNGYSYNKNYPSSSGKPSPGVMRNFSHDETFSKSPSMINNKNRNDSPNNVDKPGNNKTQFPSPTGSSGGRQDPKKPFYKAKPHTFASGPNPAMHQLNQNNSVSTNEVLKNDHHHHQQQQQQQQGRQPNHNVVRNGFTNGSTKTVNRRRMDNRDGDTGSGYRAVVSVADTGARRVSHSGSSTTDSQDVSHSVTDTPNAPDQFFTPDPSASPCSTRSSPDTAAATFQFPRGPRKPVVAPVVTAARVSNNNYE